MSKQAVLFVGETPVQIDGFPPRAARSCEGALYLTPNTASEVTEDELMHIRKEHPEAFRQLRNMAVVRRKQAQASTPPAPALVSVAPPQVPTPESAILNVAPTKSKDEESKKEASPKRSK
jgi:hypothetical protein